MLQVRAREMWDSLKFSTKYIVMQYAETEKSGETRGPLMKVTDLEIQQLDHVSRGSSTSPVWYL